MTLVDSPIPYSPRRHITATELRRLGFYLSEMIPDDAFVRRYAVGFDDSEPLNDGSVTVRLNVLEPFMIRTPTLAELVAV